MKSKSKLSEVAATTAAPTNSSISAAGANNNDRTSIIFTLNNQVGGLARALQVFQELGINVLHLELQNNDSRVEKVKRMAIDMYIK